MAERRQSSRLQRRAPSSIQISPAAVHWNAAVPLLSPLFSSPESINNLTAAINLYSNSSSKNDALADKEPEKPAPPSAAADAAAVWKKWQRTAMPSSQEQFPLVPFVCTGSAD